MALEFDCPYCKAIIRVPDSAAGKRGRCPQCATRVSVPKLGQTQRAGTEPAFFPGPPEPESVAVATQPGDDEIVFQEFDPQTAEIDPAVEAGLLPGDIAIPDLASSVPRALPQPVRQLPDSLLSRSKRRKKSSGLWIVIVFALVAASGAAGSYYWFQSSAKLEGELKAEVVENPHLPSNMISRDLIEIPADDAERILSKLESNPQPLVSSLGLSSVMIAANNKGLIISIAPGSATSLYRVEIAGDAKLAAYRRKHEAEFDERRQEKLALAVNQYCRTIKDAHDRKETRTDVKEFRDSVCYAASVQGFGSAIQAVHDRTPYLCVYEDRDAVYFLLPAGVKHFQIQGRPVKAGQRFFEGKFDVKVTGTKRLPSSKPDKSEEPEPKDEKSEMPAEDGEMTEK